MSNTPLQKNGHDQSQDRDIRDLRLSNETEHKDIGASVSGLRRMLWGLLLAGLAGIVGVVSYITAQVTSMRHDVRDLEREVDAVEILAREHESEGLEIGRGLRRDVDKLEQEVKEHRRQHRQKD